MNQSHQVVFSNIEHFTTNVNFYHLRIPVNLTSIVNAPKLALLKIKSQSKNMYKTMIAKSKKNGDYNESNSLTRAIAQQSYDTAEDIATIA